MARTLRDCDSTSEGALTQTHNAKILIGFTFKYTASAQSETMMGTAYIVGSEPVTALHVQSQVLEPAGVDSTLDRDQIMVSKSERPFNATSTNDSTKN